MKDEQNGYQDAEDFARMLLYVVDCIRYTQNTLSYDNCNNCGKKDCEYRPELGKQVRINCPLWEGEG